MWKLIYFVVAGTTPVTFTHPVDFYTQGECIAYFQLYEHEMQAPGIDYYRVLCVQDQDEIRH